MGLEEPSAQILGIFTLTDGSRPSAVRQVAEMPQPNQPFKPEFKSRLYRDSLVPTSPMNQESVFKQVTKLTINNNQVEYSIQLHIHS